MNKEVGYLNLLSRKVLHASSPIVEPKMTILLTNINYAQLSTCTLFKFILGKCNAIIYSCCITWPTGFTVFETCYQERYPIACANSEVRSEAQSDLNFRSSHKQ